MLNRSPLCVHVNVLGDLLCSKDNIRQETRPNSFVEVALHVQEVVSLGGPAHSLDHLERWRAAAASPAEFHSLLEQARAGHSDKEVVLFDTRNLYETRIGHFAAVRPPLVGQTGNTALSWLLAGPPPPLHEDVFVTRALRAANEYASRAIGTRPLPPRLLLLKCADRVSCGTFGCQSVWMACLAAVLVP